MLEVWFGKDHVESIKGTMKKIRDIAAEKNYKEASLMLEKINKGLNSNLNEARDLEGKHKKRLYVLNGLRQVSRELGFEEIKLEFEKPENEPMYKRTRIIYEVDTHDRGKIKFYVSMEGIGAHSGIVEDKCAESFDTISRKLKDEFGINTKFGRQEEEPDKKLKRKGEVDEPIGTIACMKEND